MPSNLASSNGRFGLVVYDLDGTLLETLPDLHRAVRLALADRGHPAPSRETTRAAIGDGARILVARLCPAGSSEAEVELALERFHHHYLQVCTEETTLRPGVEDFLRRRAAAGMAQAILTNKPQRPADRLVEHFGLRPWIGQVLGGDTPWGRKPATGGLLELVRRAGAVPGTTLVVGDGPADLEVARACGCACVRIDGGYGDPARLDSLPADWRAGGFPELELLWPEIDRQTRGSSRVP